MISTKKSLDPSAENIDALLNALQVLLEGVSRHVVECDPESRARFRESIQNISESLRDGPPRSEFLVLAGAAVRSLDEYNQQATARFGQLQAELNTTIKMLRESAGAVGSTSDENIGGLQQIERLVTSAREGSDLKLIKMRLGDCLDKIRNEGTRQRTQAESRTRDLLDEIENFRTRVGPGGIPHDPLTGLPSREAAESALAKYCASESPSHIAVLMVDRLQFYNTRFGRAVGDEILRRFAEYVKRTLPAGDILFRWTGPALLVVIERPRETEALRVELKRVLNQIPEHEVQTETRSALLSISSRWSVFPTTPTLQLLIRKIDLFTQIHTPRE